MSKSPLEMITTFEVFISSRLDRISNAALDQHRFLKLFKDLRAGFY